MVQYVKFQGEPDDSRGRAADDFVLVIMSKFQIAGLQQLHAPLKEVAMDLTHGTNAYDYQLTTLMVNDEHGEGFPGAFCFNNRVTEARMKVFLSVCKDSTGFQMIPPVSLSGPHLITSVSKVMPHLLNWTTSAASILSSPVVLSPFQMLPPAHRPLSRAVPPSLTYVLLL